MYYALIFMFGWLIGHIITVLIHAWRLNHLRKQLYKVLATKNKDWVYGVGYALDQLERMMDVPWEERYVNK